MVHQCCICYENFSKQKMAIYACKMDADNKCQAATCGKCVEKLLINYNVICPLCRSTRFVRKQDAEIMFKCLKSLEDLITSQIIHSIWRSSEIRSSLVRSFGKKARQVALHVASILIDVAEKASKCKLEVGAAILDGDVNQSSFVGIPQIRDALETSKLLIQQYGIDFELSTTLRTYPNAQWYC